MKFILAVSFIVLFAGTQGFFQKEQLERCKAQLGVTSEEAYQLKTGDYGNGPEENVMCLTKCIFEEAGIMKNNVLNDDVIKEKLRHKASEEEVTRVLDMCRGEVGNGECETSFKIFTCVLKNHDHGHDHEHKHGHEH